MKKFEDETSYEVKSPCIEKCSLNRNKICPECYRSIEEIVAWPDVDNLTRKKILEAAKLRRAGAQK